MQPKAVDQHACGKRVLAAGEMLGKGRAAAGGEQGGIVLSDDRRGHDGESGRFYGVFGLIVVAAEENVRSRRCAGRLSERADEGFLRLGGADVARLFGHRIEHLFAECILEELNALIDAFQFGGRLFVVFFVGKLLPLGVELADFAVVLAVVKIQ